jgi:hypothetical protein
LIKRLVAITILMTALAIAIAFLMPAVVDTQGQTKPDQVSKKESGRGATDANVKSDAATNEAGKPATLPSPAEKSGEKSRQALCTVVFDNYTDLWIKTYVDGRYRGTMAPWGELNTYAVAGPTILYARADYPSGAFDYWGPVKFSCSTRHIWRLDD